jgi:hypothetical protein
VLGRVAALQAVAVLALFAVFEAVIVRFAVNRAEPEVFEREGVWPSMLVLQRLAVMTARAVRAALALLLLLLKTWLRLLLLLMKPPLPLPSLLVFALSPSLSDGVFSPLL